MRNHSEIAVTLSDELISHLRQQAQRLHVPLRWLVASLICDTLETCIAPVARTNTTKRKA
jgi:hypothetical protein